MFVLDADALAAYEPRVVFDKRRTRDRVARISVSGDRLTLPAPSALAEMLTAPGVAAYRDGARLVLDGTPRTVEDLSADVLAAFRELRDRDDVSAPYDALRRVAVGDLTPHARREVNAHAERILRCWRDSLPALLREPKASEQTPKRAPITPVVKKAKTRNKQRYRGMLTAIAFLEGILLDEETPEGAEISGDALYGAFVTFVEERTPEVFEDDRFFEEHDRELAVPVTPLGLKDFYRIAAVALESKPPTRSSRARVFAVPEVLPASRAEGQIWRLIRDWESDEDNPLVISSV